MGCGRDLSSKIHRAGCSAPSAFLPCRVHTRLPAAGSREARLRLPIVGYRDNHDPLLLCLPGTEALRRGLHDHAGIRPLLRPRRADRGGQEDGPPQPRRIGVPEGPGEDHRTGLTEGSCHAPRLERATARRPVDEKIGSPPSSSSAFRSSAWVWVVCRAGFKGLVTGSSVARSGTGRRGRGGADGPERSGRRRRRQALCGQVPRGRRGTARAAAACRACRSGGGAARRGSRRTWGICSGPAAPCSTRSAPPPAPGPPRRGRRAGRRP